ncbi:hypothetical protein [Sphingomonas sp.]|jgi:hypothetical protein|uniref:hypothetical protein n=1 Tax=Sphingomonas sp. TaxID=28214 RepID=UPI002604F400|nr:hypothetical protein [Sphingomonas sp.]MDF2493267.1 hypothetical protein [Sphingomonas sp.]
MTALDRIERLPDWPARMTAPVAAAYMGIGHATFLVRFKHMGVKEETNMLWARAQLDRFIAHHFGLPTLNAPATPSFQDEYAIWKAGRAAKNKS